VNIPTDDLSEMLIQQFGKGNVDRLLGLLEILAGKREAPLAPMQQIDLPLFFPEITNAPWSDAELPWMRVLRDNHQIIREEAQALLDRNFELEEYGPAYDTTGQYIQKGTGSSIKGWNAFYFYRTGRRVDKNCALCPRTAELLKSVPVGQEALFSILQPNTPIPEHSDGLNFFLTCHLGLKIPPHCGIRVGSETRTWGEGETLLFNTSFLHEAWNRSDSMRIVLLVDVWHPELTSAEVEAISFLRPQLEAMLGLTPELPG
jgi:aspartate beta-hydroxylase